MEREEVIRARIDIGTIVNFEVLLSPRYRGVINVPIDNEIL